MLQYIDRFIYFKLKLTKKKGNKMKNLKFFVLAVLMAIFGCQKIEQMEKGEKTPPTREERKAIAVAGVKSVAEAKPLPKMTVDLSTLKGNKLGDLYAKYIDHPKGVQALPSVTVSFEEVMSRLYLQKINFKKYDKKTGEYIEASETVLSQAPNLYKQYLNSDKKKMNIKEFIKIADKKVLSAKKSLDWNKVCKRYGLDKKKCKLLQEIVSNLAGKDMVAYGMTELLPTANGQLNVKYLDLLLRNAGAEFLYHIPALGDGYASLGIYQFTMLSVRKDDEKTEGASVINGFVKDGGEKIADSVVYLNGHEHHVAAFYFAVHNLARLMSRLSEKGTATLSRVHNKKLDEMVAFIAAAHHAPSLALTRTKIWINTLNCKTELVTAYQRSRIQFYAIKTLNNLGAIYELK